jgi:hypothetical protein
MTMDDRLAVAVWITLLSAAWGVATILRICTWLKGRRQEVSLVLLRLKLFDYVRRYRRITRAERGQPGPLYAQFVAAWLIVLASAVSAGLLLILTS